MDEDLSLQGVRVEGELDHLRKLRRKTIILLIIAAVTVLLAAISLVILGINYSQGRQQTDLIDRICAAIISGCNGRER